jgi:hypothetical protein
MYANMMTMVILDKSKVLRIYSHYCAERKDGSNNIKNINVTEWLLHR